MKTVKLFIASSIREFKEERIHIGGYVRKLNDLIKTNGRNIHLYLCEDEGINSQAFYDRNILLSDVFIAIVGPKLGLGEFTRHEIVDVAYNCNTIKRKIIVLTGKECISFIPNDIKSEFDIKNIGNNLHCHITELLLDVIEDIFQYIPDVPESIPQEEVFLNIPNGETFEIDIINNIIRRFRDQNFNISINEEIKGYEEAYIGLLSDNVQSEKSRINTLISDNVCDEKLWLFAKQELSKHSDSLATKEMSLLHDDIINRFFLYPTYYNTYEDLSKEILIKFHDFFCQRLRSLNGGFVYIVEEHWLIRQSLLNSQKFLFINLANIDGSYERKLRKERIILNLLNQYWLNRQPQKHVDAIAKLLKNDYDGFFYNTFEDLEEMDFKRREFKQAFYDFLCDKIEQIHKISYEKNDSWLKNQIEYIHTIVVDNISELKKEDVAKVYLLLANTYSVSTNCFTEAKQLYQKALDSIREIDESYIEVLELSKYYIFTLCSRLFDQSNRNDNFIYELSQIGLTITEANDDFYKIAFKILQYASSTSFAHQDSLEVEINNSLTLEYIQKNNQNLILAIIFFITWIQIRQKKCSKIEGLENMIDFYINQYNLFLKNDPSYRDLYFTLLSKKAVALSDYELSNEILKEYTNFHGNQKQSKLYCDLLYDKGSICLTRKMIEEGVLVFQTLYKTYPTQYDKAASLQSLALCYMNGYRNDAYLCNAEESYKLSLTLFKDVEDASMCGNVWDGLSFCYILQNKFDEAEKASLKALSVIDYVTPNKHSNYITALLCQNKYEEARKHYCEVDNKDSVKSTLIKDWSNELHDIGIDTSSFNLIFKKTD